MADVAVHCAHTEMAPIESVVPHPRNPNRHTEGQIGLLAKIIAAQGWRNPITVSNRSGFVVAGHARLEAARRLGLDVVPVDRQDFESEASEYAHMLEDNRIAELSELSIPGVKDLLADMDGLIDLDLTGFDAGSVGSLMTERGVDDSSEPGVAEHAGHKMYGFYFTPEQYAEVDQIVNDAISAGHGEGPSQHKQGNALCHLLTSNPAFATD